MCGDRESVLENPMNLGHATSAIGGGAKVEIDNSPVNINITINIADPNAKLDAASPVKRLLNSIFRRTGVELSESKILEITGTIEKQIKHKS